MWDANDFRVVLIIVTILLLQLPCSNLENRHACVSPFCKKYGDRVVLAHVPADECVARPHAPNEAGVSR